MARPDPRQHDIRIEAKEAMQNSAIASDFNGGERTSLGEPRIAAGRRVRVGSLSGAAGPDETELAVGVCLDHVHLASTASSKLGSSRYSMDEDAAACSALCAVQAAIDTIARSACIENSDPFHRR